MNSFIKENAADLEAFSRMSQCAGARNDYVQGLSLIHISEPTRPY